jgi:hypothetical protein
VKFAPLAMIVAGMLGGVLLLSSNRVPSRPDQVSEVFDRQELAFRQLSKERVEILRTGSLKTEAASVEWMASRFVPAVEETWTDLLTAEAKAFGGKEWTPDKEANYVEGYTR